MENKKVYDSLPQESRIQFFKDCLNELYGFSHNDIDFYKEKLDFTILSYNRNINWDYHLLYKYKDLWDWNHIENNTSVVEKLNLPLLFPLKVSYQLTKCNCFRNHEFCEDLKYCPPSKQNSSVTSIRKEIVDVETYQLIEKLINNKIIDESIVLKVMILNVDIILVEKEETTFKT